MSRGALVAILGAFENLLVVDCVHGALVGIFALVCWGPLRGARTLRGAFAGFGLL
jgi:hypothetical protein